jgi:hypothetical protein
VRPRAALRHVARRAVADGSVASLLSTLTLAAMTRRAGHSAASGTNATSHWLWGRQAWRHERADLAHTGAGYAIHHLCSIFWACAFAGWNRLRPARTAVVAGRAAGVSAIAAFVDYKVVPRRLTPGFEAHLRPAPIAAVYVAFAAGLLLAHALQRRNARARP